MRVRHFRSASLVSVSTLSSSTDIFAPVVGTCSGCDSSGRRRVPPQASFERPSGGDTRQSARTLATRWQRRRVVRPGATVSGPGPMKMYQATTICTTASSTKITSAATAKAMSRCFSVRRLVLGIPGRYPPWTTGGAGYRSGMPRMTRTSPMRSTSTRWSSCAGLPTRRTSPTTSSTPCRRGTSHSARGSGTKACSSPTGRSASSRTCRCGDCRSSPATSTRRRLSALDPSVQAGRLSYDAFEWWVAAGTFECPGGRSVGDRRAMPDD